jgi:hypothetical protein
LYNYIEIRKVHLLKFFSPTLACLAIGLLSPSARANTISGVAYCNMTDQDAAYTPAPGVAHSGTQCAAFTASDITFSSSADTIGGFLSSGNVLGPVTYLNGFTDASSLNLSMFLFTGTAYFTQGQTYSATHDDGTVMVVGDNTVINSPWRTGALTNYFTFSDASGNYTFRYDYTQEFGGNTYTTDATVAPVPEPRSLILFATGAALLVGFRKLRPQSTNTTAA